MDLMISYIGFVQAILAIILIYNKKPLKIAYVILCSLILVFVIKFGLDILQNYNIIPANRPVISLSLTMFCAPLLYLYSKHILIDYKIFDKKDFIHAIPSLLLLLIFTILKLLPENNSISFLSLFEKYNTIKIFYGFIFQILTIYYTIASLKILIQFKKQIKHFYSFESYKINLNWLILMIVIFFVIFVLIIVSSVVYEINSTNENAIIFRHLTELFYVYILSVWGFNQNQLNSTILVDTENIKETEIKDRATGKYQKSGLKNEDVKIYIDTLVKFMEESEVWKDTELSISKLANQTSIPKHYLSEVLNEHLGKSFYGFVNEYRIEYAKKLLKSEKHNNWSILAIAYECGFNSKAVFNSFFKKHTQLTPSEYKKNQ